MPLTDRVIQIVSDSYVDINKGSGALKITPAHDFNDFKIGKKLKISFLKYLINMESLTLMFHLNIKV